MEDIFADTFGIQFTSNIVFDAIHNTNAFEIKSKISENNKSIINFTYKEAEYLYVYNIEKYENYSGTTIMKKVIELGKKLNVKYIELCDYAMFNLGDYKDLSLSLAPFHIITTGSSWYNKLGFKSDNTNDEILENEKTINLYLCDLVDNEYCERFQEEFPEIDIKNKTLKQIFIYLKQTYVNNKPERKKMTYSQSYLLEDLTLDLFYVLNYEPTLRYYFD
jgi:hypothetical protein